MPNCPNCGRQTMRTEDWACQWCGYPLVSRAYRKIPKTFRELEEERKPPARPEYEAEPELEPEPAVPRRKPAPGPVAKAGPAAEPEPEPVAEAAPEAVPERQDLPPSAEPIMVPERELAAGESAVLQPERELAAAEPVAAAEPEVEAAAGPATAAGPPPVPQDTPVAVPDLGAASGELKVSVDELNAAYTADKVAADARLAGKVITVAGVVDKAVVRDHLEIRYLLLAGTRAGGLWNVRGTFGKEHGSVLMRLASGQPVKMRGTYAGYERNILMKDCVLVG